MSCSIILLSVKTNLGITGNYQDKTIEGYIEEVKQFMLDGGVKKSIVDSREATGIITRGVLDLWDYGNGEAGFSNYFLQRVTQLALKKEDTHEEL